MALSRLGKPIVTTMHATGNFIIDKTVAEISKHVIVHNEFMAKHFSGPSVIIPHGCQPVQCPPPEECKKAFGIDPRIPVVGYQGFISTYKGLETLIEAMTRVPNTALLIGGGWHVEAETDYIMKLKQWSLEVLPRRCQWLGYVPEEQLSMVYGAMDVLCYCSRFATESGALTMGLAHGRPTIASNLPPFKEKEKEGALITFKGVRDLAVKIKRLLKNGELRRKLEEGARAYADSVKWFPNIAEKHISLYKDVLNKEQH